MRDPMHTPKCDHSTRGAKIAYEQSNYPISFDIAGHHGHLPNGGAKCEQDTQRSTLTSRMKKPLPDCAAFLNRFPVELPPLSELSALLAPYDGQDRFSYALSFFTRMLYACLVDADYLDTERFMRPAQMQRGAFQSAEVLERRLNAYMTANYTACGGALNDARARIRAWCLRAAELAPGFFSLTVPTGGGKTPASLAFALRHAVLRPCATGVRRVIYAIPYTGILEQTADAFARARGSRGSYSKPMTM